MIRVGILGLGFGAAVQLPAFRQLPGVEVVALGGRRVDKARELAAKLGIATGGSMEEVFAARPDMISVALPPGLSAAACLRGLELGMAVLAEKPLAHDAANAAALAARARGRTAAIDFELAELNSFRELKRQSEANHIESVRVRWHTRSFSHEQRHWSWKVDALQHGGVMNLLGSHVLFLAEWLLGPLDSLSARFSSERTQAFAPEGAQPAEDRARLRAVARGGAVLDIELDNAAGGAGQSWQVLQAGSRLLLEERGAAGDLQLERESGGVREVLAADTVPAGVDWRIEPIRRLAKRFVACAAAGTPCFPGFDSGARVQQLLEAARTSARQDGAAVDVSGEPR